MGELNFDQQDTSRESSARLSKPEDEPNIDDDETEFSEFNLEELKDQYKSLEQSMHVSNEVNSAMTSVEQRNDIGKRLDRLGKEIKNREGGL